MHGIIAVITDKNNIDNIINISDQSNYTWINAGKKSLSLTYSGLSIIGDKTPQPFEQDGVYLVIKGEIFNWKELSKEVCYTCNKSDCEILFPLYNKYRYNLNELFNKINGQYSFILYDSNDDMVLVGRDHIGLTSLYYGYNDYNDYTKVFASEIKSLIDFNINNIRTFHPRTFSHFPIYEDINFSTYLDFYNTTPSNTSSIDIIKRNIYTLLRNSVHDQLNDLLHGGINFGILLSGGLNSSLIASIISSLTKNIKTFSIGMDSFSRDIISARIVVKFLQNKGINVSHREYFFTKKEGLDAIKDVIWDCETYDTATIRAGVPLFLLIQKIKHDYPDLKVLFSGDLADELFCYPYGSLAPTLHEFQKEILGLVSNVHSFDCQRVNKICMNKSIEVRVPFANLTFVKYVLSIKPEFKAFGHLGYNKIPKQILRESFLGTLPLEILYRKSDEFSSGIDGQESWVANIKTFSKIIYPNRLLFLSKTYKYYTNRPETTEELFYRELFEQQFPTIFTNTTSLIKCWRPKWTNSMDPSAREYMLSGKIIPIYIF